MANYTGAAWIMHDGAEVRVAAVLDSRSTIRGLGWSGLLNGPLPWSEISAAKQPIDIRTEKGTGRCLVTKVMHHNGVLIGVEVVTAGGPPPF